MTTLPPKRPVRKPPKAPQASVPSPSKPTRTAKKFTTAAWSGGGEGEKITLYAESGMGKTTLASLLSKPVFIGVDDGGRKLKDRILKHIPGIGSFDDLRDALHQMDLYDNYESVVVDTLTKVDEDWALAWTLANVKTEKGGVASDIERYGWGKGFRHKYDTMRLLLADFDALVRAGKNVVLLCQSTTEPVSNPSGEDFLRDAPKLQLQHGKTPSIVGMYVEWCDHVLRIGYGDVTTADKKASSTGERVIFVHPQIYFTAKSRTIPNEYPVVSFESPEDDSIWQFIFNKAWEGME